MKRRCHARLGARTRVGTSPRSRDFRTTLQGAAVAAPPVLGSFVLLETGDYLLLETGDKIILES